ncbi:DUF1580 domain-containing protein [Rubripirellula reticaptiva]|uniref:Uncharacterized protein n=1 Tax=Rubripirellula reticaptiva TaxID=2528013 RepID=A0A5C6FDD2_9BACT|nr:DUF1580 domain-containing protein [Rubripirellula reticaptiva]TWU57679.1 hypothetical protein Poly59_05860 [Rubripirellula reticaptiva]
MVTPDPYRMVRLNAGAASIVEGITGDRPSSATMYRWAQRGLKGVKLQTAFAGGHRRTTEQWIREFFAAITEAVDGTAVAPPKPVDRDKQIKRAEAELEAAGI